MRRFDDELMRPPVPNPAEVDADLLRSLRAWCENGALPRMTHAFAVARMAPHPGLDAVACELDGSHALARLGRWRGLAWRLRIALRDRRDDRDLRNDDPWDAGWWREGALSTASAFRPRRPTLLMASEDGRSRTQDLVEALAAASVAYRKPLRLVVVSALDQAELAPQLKPLAVITASHRSTARAS